MNPKKQFFYLTKLHYKINDKSIKAICIEETGYFEYNVSFITFDLYGGQRNYDGIRLEGLNINRISLSNKELLTINYQFNFNEERTASLRISSTRHETIAQYLQELFLFIENNADLIKEHGLRENLGHDYVLSSLSLKSFFEKVLNMKTHRVNSSVSRVGKDNDFYETMVVTYDNDKDYYFIKLLSDFWKTNFNPERKQFSTTSHESAWSPAFESYISEDNYTSERARLIDYIAKHFDFAEGCKHSLINLPYPKYNLR